jgi:hypothetical protein
VFVFDSAHVHHGVMEWQPEIQEVTDNGRIPGRLAWVWFTQKAVADQVQAAVEKVTSERARAQRERAALLASQSLDSLILSEATTSLKLNHHQKVTQAAKKAEKKKKNKSVYKKSRSFHWKKGRGDENTEVGA